MATTRAERIFTAVTAVRAAPRGRALVAVASCPDEAVAVRELPRESRAAAAWTLARDAAGGLVVLGSWAALWTWFLAATL